MRKMKKPGYKKTLRSPVARHLNTVTRCVTHRNRKTDYKRKPKHPGSDE